MASIIIKSPDVPAAGVFHRRVLIGRKPFNGVQFSERAVSRIHAWIDRNEEGFYIADSGSRAGPYVNAEKIKAKRILHEGDVIKIGPEEFTFHETDELPSGCITFLIAEDGTNPDFKMGGILMACACGAPLWVPQSMAGAYGHCNVCKGDITVPGAPLTGVRRPLTPSDSIADMPAIKDVGSTDRPEDPLGADHHREIDDWDLTDPTPQPAASKLACSVCQGAIMPHDDTTDCPSCSQRYHTECWRENQGCAAYGCDQVGAWAAIPLPTLAEPVKVMTGAGQSNAAAKPFPWDFALLGGSVLGTILGAFTFGVPALAMGAASTIYAYRGRNGAGRTRIAALSAVICVLGVAAGVVTSRFLWFNVMPWGRQ